MATPQQPAQAEPKVDEFEIMRRRLRQRGAASGEGQQRQLNRQFASLGNLPSGAAFKVRQQAQEAQGRQTSEAVQDVNVLQAQTQRAERESAAQRKLQKFGITTQADTAIKTAEIGAEAGLEQAEIAAESALETTKLGTASAETIAELQGNFGITAANISAESALNVERMRGKHGSEQQQAAIKASQDELTQTLASNESLAQMDAATKTYLGDLDFDARMKQLEVSDATARFMGGLDIQKQLDIAEFDRDLKSRGQDIQRLMVDSQIEAANQESVLNTFATYVNAIGALKQSGMKAEQVTDLIGTLVPDFDVETVQPFIQKVYKSASEARAEDKFE